MSFPIFRALSWLPFFLLLCFTSVGFSTQVHAMSLSQATQMLDKAKTQGWVGEQFDGYLGVIKANAQTQDLASTINQARQQEYQRIANKHGLTLQQVAQRAGQKAIARTPAGQYIKTASGWVRK
ncbi:hypothetical protein SAMN05421831_108123 [Allopseudospirillum japonicum]|uniref:DUF1318 domain-containing protein n=1 Tax=Allopseudospirillum japonicum TaxID=64971 RepID=A0A1H6SX43_9GAMM|nr:DUF1318 domain-containing protein [Allopseudospirillum japonicum]SEI72508.1 hypothetical protein SAMN05421831_108123 [Allopseudospirillum japonicum]